MARSVEVIKAEIKTKIRTYPSLDSFLFSEEGGSQVGVFNLLIAVTAIALSTFEQLMDIVKEDTQAIADAAPSGNPAWIQAQILKFQYGDTVVMTDFVPGYAVVDEDARIVTRCSVRDSGGTVTIKVAKGEDPPEPLDSAELTALQNYYFGTANTQGVGFAGIPTIFVNRDPDLMRVQATIYYLGQYVEATVKTAVIDAIEAFFASFQDEFFDGTMFMMRLVDKIQEVEGVSRVVLEDIKARASDVALVDASDVDIQGYYVTVAGYIVSETTTGETLEDTITMAVEVA